ncbi:MAG: four helix bundle protein, partial [Bacteroidetes bacterium]|nr:four helix bundle protein [Bacteroidota bacterium]
MNKLTWAAYALIPKDLIVFKSAIKLAIRIHQLSKNFPNEEKYSLTDQIRR